MVPESEAETEEENFVCPRMSDFEKSEKPRSRLQIKTVFFSLQRKTG